MARLEILTFPDERLKQVSQPVETFDDRLRQFLRDLEETMDGGPPSVGIAAPQVGRFERILLVDVSIKPKIKNHGRLFLLKPRIVAEQGQEVAREGCLSVPDFTGNVSRAETIELEAQDPYGSPLSFTMTGFEARAVQHEMDHLDGLLFLDRLVSRRDLFRRKKYK